MVFFAENIKKLDSGAVGIDATLSAKNLEVAATFFDFVEPFKLRCGTIENAFNLHFLSKSASPLGLHIVCHGHIINGKLERLTMTMRRKPKSAPPRTLAETSDKLGGYPSGFQKFLEAMGSPEVKCRASTTIYLFKTKKGSIKINRPTLPKKIGSFDLEHSDIHLQDRTLQTQITVVFTPGDDSSLMEINSFLDIQLNDTCFDDASGQLFKKAQSLFNKK